MALPVFQMIRQAGPRASTLSPYSMDSYSPMPPTEVIAPRSSGSYVTPAPIMQLICHCEIPVPEPAMVCAALLWMLEEGHWLWHLMAVFLVGGASVAVVSLLL